MNIQKTWDDYSTFFWSKLKAQDGLGEIVSMKVFLEDIRKWKKEFQKDENKPSTLRSSELHSYHTTCSWTLEQ